MAEETPGNLGFGGHVAGRAVDDNRGIDRATDRLESEINRFADALEKLTAGLSGAQSSSGVGGGGAQTKYANGGQTTFGGEPAHRFEGHSTGKTSWSVGQTGGAHRGPPDERSGTVMSPFANGGQHNANPHRISKGVAYGALAATAVYTAGHYSSQVTGQTLASMYSEGNNWEAGYRGGMMGNYTAHGTKDHWATISMMGMRSGYGAGTQGWNQVRNQIMSTSATNPMISNVESASATMSLSSTTSINRLARMGINPLGAGGRGDPAGIARQLLTKMQAHRVKTKEQVDAAFGPSGSATVTLDSYVDAGYIPAEARNAIESHMRNILRAQIRGVGAQEYQRLATTANTSEASREKLQEMGIPTETLTQKQHQLEGKRRQSEVETIKGFDWSVRRTTDALGAFRDVLTAILKIPGLGELVGGVGGATGTAPIVGTLLNKVPFGSQIGQTLGVMGGTGPASMSSSQMSYGGASGAGAARAGFGTGGLNVRSSVGGSTGSSQGMGNRYSLGPVKPWVAKAASVLGPKFGISVIGGYGQRSTPSDHPKGLALDFMCGKSAGDSLSAYAVANHKALNITYVIWRQRIWSINNPRWTAMEDRGDPTSNHYDHVHISFLASPSNADYSDLPAGGGLGGGKGNALGQGASSPDNGTSAAFAGGTSAGLSGAFSEVAALGLSGGGYAVSSAVGVGGAAGEIGATGGGRGRRGGQGGGLGGVSRLGGYGSGAAGTVRSGTYNVGSLKGKTNPAADLEKLIGPADVLALTEVNPQRLRALRRGLEDDNWAVYAGDGSASGAYALDASIAYDKSKYQFVKGGTYKLGDLTGNFLGGRGKRFANYALLKDRDTGMSFWQVAAHTVPMANADQPHRRMHKEQFDSLDNLVEMLKKTGIPVIMGGDFNQQRNRDFWRNPSGMSSARGGGVDHVFGQVGAVKTTDLDMIKGLSGDHSGAVLATMSIKGTGGGPAPRGNGGTPQQNMALGRSLAAARGWTGPQWQALKNLWMRESGWRHDADNPSSSAYGIPQALTDLHGLGEKYMNDPRTQIQWGLNYIAGRYGNPVKAWNFWQQEGYYKVGSWNVRADQDARVHKGEMIFPSKIADIIRDELSSPGIRDNLGRSRSGGSGQVQVTFESGSIKVFLGGDVDEGGARQAGRWVVDAMMEDARFKALAEGR